ncbi:MAG: efflux RND transporter periplasmic adaptor subunit, partial [Dehalococcoidia bacterium]
FTLLDPDLLRIDATVDESNVSKIKAGLPVTITFDSLTGQSFQGVVASVTPSGASSQGVVTFPVTVVFNTQGYTIPPGTTANLSIITESRPNVLAVPSRAVTQQGTQSVVQVLENGEPVAKPVQTGITGNNFTEILSGLSDGEQIVISTTGTTGGQQTSGALGTSGLGGTGGGPPSGGGGPVIIGPR